MDKIFSVIIGISVVVGVLVPVGIVVCILAISTESFAVFVVGAGLGIALACYCGYRVAFSTLNPPDQGPLPIWRDTDKSDHTQGSSK
jgi:hypothetical protein